MTARFQPKESEVFMKRNPSLEFKFVYIDYVLTSEDSLQSLSFKFGVPITDLKRINFLQNDRDIYALKSIKIPIKPFSLLAEQYANQLKYSDTNLNRLNDNSLDFETHEVNSNPADSENEVLNENSDSDHAMPQQSQTKIVGYDTNNDLIAETDLMNSYMDANATTSLLANQETTFTNESYDKIKKQQSKEAKKFFKKMDNEVKSLKTQNTELIANVQRAHSSDVEQLIPISNISYSIESRQNNFSSGKGLKMNLNVRDLLIIACLIVVFFPIAILIYEYYNKSNILFNING